MIIARAISAGIFMTLTASGIAAEKSGMIEGKQGEQVHLSVESHPTAGYSWMIKKLPEQLIYVSSVYEPDNCKKGELGCSGIETFTFIAGKPGKGELKLINGQSFDKSSWEEKTVNVDIK